MKSLFVQEILGKYRLFLSFKHITNTEREREREREREGGREGAQ